MASDIAVCCYHVLPRRFYQPLPEGGSDSNHRPRQRVLEGFKARRQTAYRDANVGTARNLAQIVKPCIAGMRTAAKGKLNDDSSQGMDHGGSKVASFIE